MEAKSLRQDQIDQDVRDILKYYFSLNLDAPFNVNAVEIKIDCNQMDALLDGGENFVQHSLSQSWEYFTHKDDPEWALIFDFDCDGDLERGRKIMLSQVLGAV